MHLAIDRVRLIVVGEDLKGIGMHEQRVVLGEVDGYRTIGGHRIAGRVVIFGIVACQHRLVDGVGKHHIPIGVVGASLGIVEHAVAYQGASLVLDNGTPKELRLFGLGIIVTILTIDAAGAGGDVRGAYDMGS